MLTERAPLRHAWAAGQLVAVFVVTPSHVYPGAEADQARGQREASTEASDPQLARGWPQE